MEEHPVSIDTASVPAPAALLRHAYRLVGHVTLFSVFASLLFGFRFDAAAPPNNLAWNLILYGVFIVPHLVMTREWFKRAVWGNPAGHPMERRVYILVTAFTWFAILILHRPIPGPVIAVPAWVTFVGVVFFLMTFRMFFEGISMPMIDGLLGVPGAVKAFSHGPDTPLFQEGPYAQVRHPMYRAFFLAAAASLLVHPHVGQLFWITLFGATFLAFIPVEEAQMIRARADDYLEYRKRTPWRLFRGIW